MNIYVFIHLGEVVVLWSRYRMFLTPQRDAELCKKPPIAYESQQRISSVIKKMITHDWTVGRDYGERLKMLNLAGGEGPHKLLLRQRCKEEANSDSRLETASLTYFSLLLSFSSVTQLCPTLWPHGLQHTRLPCPASTPGAYSNSCPLSRWCHPTISSCRPLLLPPSIFPSIRVFSSESVLHIRWPKYWSFSISPSNEYSRLISFRMDWLDLLAVQGTLSRVFSNIFL